MDNSPSFWNLDFLKEMWEVVNDLLMRFYVYVTFPFSSPLKVR